MRTFLRRLRFLILLMLPLVARAQFGSGQTNVQFYGTGNQVTTGAVWTFNSGSALQFQIGSATTNQLLYITNTSGNVAPLTLGSGLSISGGTLVAGSSTSANPTGSVGTTAVNGSASTFMRSDAAPPLNLAMVPTLTGLWTFSPTSAITTGSDYGLKITPTLNQRNATNFSALYINETVTQAGTGNQYLIESAVGGTDEFTASAAGVLGPSTLAWNGAVIGSNYGGAGTVTGVLYANGSGVVSAALQGAGIQFVGNTIETASCGNGYVLGNVAGGSSPAIATPIGSFLDYLGNTSQGTILYRGSAGWQPLSAGSSGYVLETQGSSANPVWAAVGGSITAAATSILGNSGTSTAAPSSLTSGIVLGTTSQPYTDSGIGIYQWSSVSGYFQWILQNTYNGATASADVIVGNNNNTATTYYGDFGINSSSFAGSGSFNLGNAVYVTATSGDLALGTTTNNAIHFVINGSTSDAMTISTSSVLSVANAPIFASMTTAGIVINAASSGQLSSVSNASSVSSTLTGILGSGTASSSTFLRGDGTWATPAGGISISGTPTNGQIAVWTNATTLSGVTNLTVPGTLTATGASTLTGNVGIGGAPNGTLSALYVTSSLSGNGEYGMSFAPTLNLTTNSYQGGAIANFPTIATGTATGLLYFGTVFNTPSKTGTGTIATAYQIYIAQGVAATTGYGIYQAGTDPDYFGGAVTFGGAITPSQTAGIVGTTTNNNANAGSVGEVISSSATSVSLTSGNTTTVTSVSLTAGDWDVFSQITIIPAGTTVLASAQSGVNSLSATLPAVTDPSYYAVLYATGTGITQTANPVMKRISIASTTTEYLNLYVNFSTSTCTCDGNLVARRAR